MRSNTRVNNAGHESEQKPQSPVTQKITRIREVTTGKCKSREYVSKTSIIFLQKILKLTQALCAFISRKSNCVKKTWVYKIYPGRDDLELEGNRSVIYVHSYMHPEEIDQDGFCSSIFYFRTKMLQMGFCDKVKIKHD